MKILVTGANGYIGSKITKKLLDLGNEVIATDISIEHIDKRAKIIKTDIFGNEDYFELFERPDVCLHLAWRDGFVHSSINHILDLPKHYVFLTSLLDSGLKHLAVMGSMHEIGYHEGMIDENTPCNPKTNYGIAKNALRQLLENYVNNNHPDCVFQWLRAFYIFGDDLFGNSIFVKLRKAAMDGQTLFPFTTGKNKFDFISDTELCNQIAAVITQDRINGIINVCSGVPVSLGEQIEWYIKEYNLNIKLDYGKFKERPTESPCIYGDNSRIMQIMNNILTI